MSGMLKRSIVLSSPCSVSLRNNQLTIAVKGSDTPASVPVEDLAVVIIENQQVSVTMPALNAMLAQNVVVALCDAKGMPSGLFSSLEGNSLQGERYRTQLQASLPSKKSIWKQIVEAKIRNQSRMLSSRGLRGELLRPYYSNVKSGDADNREGIAAGVYWKELFGPGFVRGRFGDAPNSLLNYGYSILRAATARAIIAAGMLPTLGLHHKSRYNSFPLADDLMEPFRPVVDEIVARLVNLSVLELTREAKAELINVLYADVKVDDRRHPLSMALRILCNSVKDIMSGDSNRLSVPEFCVSS